MALDTAYKLAGAPLQDDLEAGRHHGRRRGVQLVHLQDAARTVASVHRQLGRTQPPGNARFNVGHGQAASIDRVTEV
jgi:hypothetical protein